MFQKQPAIEGLTKEQVTRAALLAKRMHEQGALKDGQHVRLDYARIVEEPDYPKMQLAWRQFVEEHKADVLTICHDPNCKLDNVVCVVEDQHDPKWLFWEGYFKVVK